MKRFLLALALSLSLTAVGGAGADTFTIVPSAPATLPSAEAPNLPAALIVPIAFTAPPVQPEPLSVPALQELWQRAGATYGIPWQVLAAINKVESNFGRNMGPSSAGAIGWMQFLPSTWERWGLDADGDGIADPWNAEDAVYAAARYLAAAGGRADLARAVFAYNHAQWYVDEVLQLAALYGQAGVDATFALDRLQEVLDRAEQDVVESNRALVAAVRDERRLAREEDRLLADADGAELLSDRLVARRRAVQLDVRRQAAQADIERLGVELEAAEATLRWARERARAAAFSPGAGTLLAAPAYQSEYVFPVGGGAGAVSVARDHHDYPAADIAAPAGSPVYALAGGVVLRAWRLPDERCGIGLTLVAADGLTWTYCHLAYLDAAVTAGAVLAAGDLVGLVGETGDATGPHLHLQLQPATSFPQDQPWFQAFAGSTFHWQEEDAASAGAATGPVFVVVPSAPEGGPVIAFTLQGVNSAPVPAE